MKLDTKALRYLTNEDWRVLTAVETGSRNHEVVPTPLIVQISGLRGAGGVHRSISTLAKASLIGKVKNATYDGYRLTYGGLDYLSLHTHLKQNTLTSLGSQIGTGKESDVYLVASASGARHVLKIHRLGRVSFRTVKTNRDYLRHRRSSSWMYMSRLAALKEYTFMRALWDAGFPVPEPRGYNRHTVVMGLVDGWPLRQMKGEDVPDPAGLYADCMELVVRLAGRGLIHGDLNEFNIIVKEEKGEDEEPGGMVRPSDPSPTTTESLPPLLSSTTTTCPSSDSQPPPPPPPPSADPSDPTTPPTSKPQTLLTPILIDFPQMVSTSHPNAATYFARDVEGLKRFFERRFHFVSDDPGPFFEDYNPATIITTAKYSSRRKKGSETGELAGNEAGNKRLDVLVEASGFSKKMAKELEEYLESVGGREDVEDEDEAADEDDEDHRDEEDAESETTVEGKGEENDGVRIAVTSARVEQLSLVG